jgi:hypothetical protein
MGPCIEFSILIWPLMLVMAFSLAWSMQWLVAGFIGSLLGANAVSNFAVEPLRKSFPFMPPYSN